jgi:hypothetical protein
MVTHGTRYCWLDFMVIEQEMSENFGGLQRGGYRGAKKNLLKIVVP